MQISLTFWSVAQRLALCADVQTQVSSLQSNPHSNEQDRGAFNGIMACKKVLQELHTSFQAMGSVLKRELVSSTERRFL